MTKERLIPPEIRAQRHLLLLLLLLLVLVVLLGLLAHERQVTPLGLHQRRPPLGFQAAHSTPEAHLKVHEVTQTTPAPGVSQERPQALLVLRGQLTEGGGGDATSEMSRRQRAAGQAHDVDSDAVACYHGAYRY